MASKKKLVIKIKAKLAQIERLKTKIGLLRDDLRDKIDELGNIFQDVDGAHADIDDAMRTMESAVDSLISPTT